MSWRRTASALVAATTCLGWMPGCDPASNAAWTIESRDVVSESPGIRHIRLSLRETGSQIDVHLAVFDAASHDIVVIDNPGHRFSDLAGAMRANACIAGVNGGYFHPDYRPLGLVVADGNIIHPQERASLLSGILAANEGQIYLLRPPEFKLGPMTRNVLQAGPFLVDKARPARGLENSKRARRTAILTDGGAIWALASLSPVTLDEAAEILATRGLLDSSKVVRALNLDGGSSSAFWFQQPGSDRAYYLPELTRVRNYLGVVPRGAR